ncbi:MAG: hypothetical protein N2234_05865, partial [Planctomycetota bacterium]|nr:hypothetical protein [Planctomycetota bacterium]
FIVSTREKKFLVVVVADDLSEREEYRLYRTAADFALKNRFLLFVFPYSSSDFRRRENLAFITRIVSEGEEL